MHSHRPQVHAARTLDDELSALNAQLAGEWHLPFNDG
jgi:hypothetical protein